MQSPRATLLCQYRYDPLDRLVADEQPKLPERQRFYCKSRLATEVQGATRYSIVQNEDQLLAQQQTKGGAPETTLLVTDPQRSVLQTLNENHPPQSIAYTPYGGVFLNALLSLLGFNGERRDPVTGSYLLGNGYRTFNPLLMRFNSSDALSPFGKGGLNAYAYCLGNPVSFSDSTGHMPKSILDLVRSVTKTTRTPSGSNMYQIRMIDDAAFTFIDKSRGKTRLNIKAHGEPGEPGEASRVVFKHRTLSPEQLHAELRINYPFDEFDDIRILACHSADGGSNSFAAKFSQITGKPVKGFSGIVVANNDPADILEQFNYSRQHSPQDPYKDLDDFFQNQIHRIEKGKSVRFFPKKTAEIRGG